MDVITIPKTHSKEMLANKEWQALLNIPTQLLKTILMSIAYEKDGFGSRYVYSGFALIESGDYYVKIQPGIAIIQDYLVSSDIDEHIITLSQQAVDGDTIYLTYETKPDNAITKNIVDDETEITEITPRFIETQKSLYTQNRLIAKLVLKKDDEFVDPLTHIPILGFVHLDPITGEVIDQWSPAQKITDITVSQHKNMFSHPKKSVPSNKISLGIIGNYYKENYDLNLKDMSDQIKQLQGNFGIIGEQPITQRITGQIANGGQYVLNTVYDPPGGGLLVDYRGIDDIFLEAVDKKLMRGLGGSSPTAPGSEWTGYQYHNKSVPTPAFRTDFWGQIIYKINPHAMRTKTNGSVAAAISGLLPHGHASYRPSIAINFYGGVPKFISYGPNDIPISQTKGIGSIANLSFNIARDGMQIHLICGFSPAGNGYEHNTKAKTYRVWEDTFAFPPYKGGEFLEEYWMEDRFSSFDDFIQDYHEHNDDCSVYYISYGSCNYMIVGIK